MRIFLYTENYLWHFTVLRWHLKIQTLKLSKSGGPLNLRYLVMTTYRQEYQMIY
ncbi:hypothetical protein SAMN05216241_101560 [Limimonas halophila]|uniref:Uncharacterized protein n=1 Tax=Limimonas halophila TaxID=1082479 RepID=A0A1G7MC37_9PROT|nr:hypothetical protein SAMN05216241_101560 [Limimonas halophila]